MSWFRKNKVTPSAAWLRLSEDFEHSRHKGDMLASCPTDAERARLCQRWAEEARDRWFQGQRETVQDMMLSTDRRYRQYDRAARRAIGEMKWGRSLAARDIASVEQMYLRWVSMYVAVSRLDPH